MKIFRSIIPGLMTVVSLLLSSCEGTWIMYDTSQKDRLYVETASTPSVLSFALVSDNEMSYKVNVKMLGMPVNKDRTFTVEYIDAASDEKVLSGGEQFETFTAVQGTDFTVAPLVLPAGAVETTMNFTLKRSEALKTKFASVHFRIVEDDEFMPMDQDSTDVDAIVSREYQFYFNDADPVMPYWWGATASSLGYQMYVGNFYVEKYRYMLDCYHDIQTKNPALYETMVNTYGENIDKEGLKISFWSSQDQAVWATYVLIPTYEYFKELYETETDHPNATKDTFGSRSGEWKDPISLLR